jgi:hypothetical protein
VRPHDALGHLVHCRLLARRIRPVTASPRAIKSVSAPPLSFARDAPVAIWLVGGSCLHRPARAKIGQKFRARRHRQGKETAQLQGFFELPGLDSNQQLSG